MKKAAMLKKLMESQKGTARIAYSTDLMKVTK